MNFPNSRWCHACKNALAGAELVSVLAFERPNGNVDWTPADEIGALAYNAGLGFVVITSCDSTRITDELVFHRLAADLVHAGAPAVIGLQIPAGETYPTGFVNNFYQALNQFGDAARAVYIARQTIRDGDWYSPAIYMRTQPDRVENASMAYDSRQIDGILPTQAAAGETTQARLWVRLPGSEPIDALRLRQSFNLPGNVALKLEQTPPGAGSSKTGESEPARRKVLRPGKLEVILFAVGCEVTPEKVNLFVDDLLDPPPAFFRIKAHQMGEISAQFEIRQDGGLVTALGGSFEVVETGELSEVRVQVATDTIPISDEIVEIGSERLCSDCGVPTRDGVKFCRHCGAEMPVSKPLAGVAIAGIEGKSELDLQADSPTVKEIDSQTPDEGAPQPDHGSGLPEVIDCYDCGQTNRVGVRFCRHCGAELDGAPMQPEAEASQADGTEDSAPEQPASKTTQMNLCADCGHPNRADVRFCRHCGAALAEAAGETEQPEETEAPTAAAQDKQGIAETPEAALDKALDSLIAMEPEPEPHSELAASPAPETPLAPPDPQAPIVFCMRCGFSNPERSTFCDDCGADLAEAASAMTAPATDPSFQDKGSWPLFGDLKTGDCGECGEGNPAGSPFCQNCGIALEIKFPLSEPAGASETPVTQKEILPDASQPEERPAILPPPTPEPPPIAHQASPAEEPATLVSAPMAVAGESVSGGRKVCSACGSKNPPKAVVCVQCNALFELPEELSSGSKGGKPKGRRWLWFFLILVLILAGAGVAWWYFIGF